MKGNDHRRVRVTMPVPSMQQKRRRFEREDGGCVLPQIKHHLMSYGGCNLANGAREPDLHGAMMMSCVYRKPRSVEERSESRKLTE
jgi:hypothetical protein